MLEGIGSTHCAAGDSQQVLKEHTPCTGVALHLFDELNLADFSFAIFKNNVLLLCTVELNMFVHFHQESMGLDVR